MGLLKISSRHFFQITAADLWGHFEGQLWYNYNYEASFLIVATVNCQGKKSTSQPHKESRNIKSESNKYNLFVAFTLNLIFKSESI